MSVASRMYAVRLFLAPVVVAVGFGVGWVTSSGVGVIAGMAVFVAGANGYAKACSP